MNLEFHQLLSTANDFATQFPWQYLLMAGVISPIGVFIKKLADIQAKKKYTVLHVPFVHTFKFTGEQLMFSMVAGMSYLAAGLSYALHYPTHDPTLIAIQGTILGFATQPVYYFMVKPFLGYVQSELAKDAQENLTIKSAAVPVGGLTPATSQEFSQ
jgi:hypothetical protein